MFTKEAYEGAEQTHKQPHTRNHEEPSVRHGFERFDLVSERQQLLRDTETETELCLPVHNRTREPADQRTQRRAREKAKDESCDRAGEHRAADGKPDEKVVHHAGRRLTLESTKIATTSTTAGRANPYAM